MKSGLHFAAVAAVVAALMAGVSLLGNDYYLRILFMMCVYYMCAAGMNVLVGFAGQKSLGQAGLFAAGAYAVALLTTRTDMRLTMPMNQVVGTAGSVATYSLSTARIG